LKVDLHLATKLTKSINMHRLIVFLFFSHVFDECKIHDQ